MPKTPREMREAILRNLKANTGKDLAEWLAVLKKSGPNDPKEARAWLKDKHGLGHGQAGMIAMELTGGPAFANAPGTLVDAQYAGNKAGLRPIYDKLVLAAKALGADVRIEPCTGYVPFIRGRQFAIVRASTRIRADLGLALGVQPEAGRLLSRPPPGATDRITHRIELWSPGDVDAEVVRWLKKAYQAAK